MPGVVEEVSISRWRDCIVSYFDLSGIGKKINANNSEAVVLMRRMHAVVHRKISSDMPAHDQAYAWNDSALFLAFPKADQDYERIMRELNLLKIEVDAICKSYCICVKGQSIPGPDNVKGVQVDSTTPPGQTRFIFMRTSSYALSNCFLIEKELGKKKGLRMDWYVDSRIVEKIQSFPQGDNFSLKMKPSGEMRDVRTILGRLWN